MIYAFQLSMPKELLHFNKHKQNKPVIASAVQQIDIAIKTGMLTAIPTGSLPDPKHEQHIPRGDNPKMS